MEFKEVVRHRRMVRKYEQNRPVPPEVLDEVVRVMLRAPSAGFSQGTALLVLTGEDVARFRTAVTPATDAENWLAANIEAPAVIVVLSNKDAYLDRYARPDKGFTDRSDAWWTAPYWDIDAGMAALLGLLSAVDQGLGACFFGVEINTVPHLRAAFAIPERFWPIGVVSLGYAAEPPRNLSAHRKPQSTLVHHGRWTEEDATDPGVH